MSDSYEKSKLSKTPQEMVRGWLWAVVPKTWVEWVVVVLVILTLIAIQMPAVQHGHPERAIRRNLVAMNLAMGEYQLENEELTRDVAVDGVVVHGWQTMLLPQLGYEELFKRIDLRKPWDDEANRAVFQERIREFEMPTMNDKKRSHSTPTSPVIQMAGNSQVMNQHDIHSWNDIKDGTSQTILIGEIDTQLSSWGKPGNVRDPAIGLDQPNGFGGYFDRSVVFLMADGSVEWLRVDIDHEVLRALASPNEQDEARVF